MTRASDLAKLLGAGATILDGTTISTADNTTQLTLTSTDADSSVGPVLDLVRDSASPADGDGIGQIKFIADNDAGEATTYSSAFTTLRDASNGAEDGQTINYVMTGGALVDHLRMGRSAANGQSEVIINEGSADIDFRVESNGEAYALFVDGGNNSVCVGKSSDVLTEAGSAFSNLQSGGHHYFAICNTDGAAANSTMYINRQSADGTLIEFRKGNTAVGVIGSAGTGSEIFFSGSSNQSGTCGLYMANSARVVPMKAAVVADDVVDLGHPSYRFDDVFATNTSISTSDKNEKQDIEELTDAEKRVAVVAKGLMRKFRWKSKVAEKGDKARTHFGIIAQDLQDAFTAESLDASKYAMFCSDTWWEKEISVDAVKAVDEVKDEEGNVTTEAVEAKDAYTYMDTKDEATTGYTERTRLGVRYGELLAFIISAI